MSAEILAGCKPIASSVLHQYDNDNNGDDLKKPLKPNFTEGGGAPSTSLECVKRALVDYCDICLDDTRKGASALRVGIKGGSVIFVYLMSVFCRF